MNARGSRGRTALGVSAVLCCAALAPAAAHAASMDTYVDDGAPDNNLPCTQADPCKQIDTALGDTLAGGTVHVAPGTYSGAAHTNINIADGRSIVYDGTGPQYGAVIDNSNLGIAFIVASSGAGTISGFDFAGQQGLSVTGNATIAGNRFSRTADNTTGMGVVGTAVTAATNISGNSFTDDGLDRKTGISLSGGATPVIQGNTFAGLSSPIDVIGASPQIVGNEMTGIHHVPAPFFNGVGINVSEGASGSNPSIRQNFIHAPPPGGSNTSAVRLTKTVNNAVMVGASFERNRILGYDTGVSIQNTNGPVTLNSDLIASFGNDLDLVDQSSMLGDADATATNLTSASAIRVFSAGAGTDADLTLDSSIARFIQSSGLGSVTHGCVITNSRGDTTSGAPAENGCGSFQTTADPQFIDDDPFGDETNDYRLAAGSPLLDAGAPGPAPGLALDGNPRAIAATCGGTPRRDMGAYEFEPSCPSTGGGTGGDGGTTTPPPVKKCKKGQKLKKGKCVKKKRKRKKKK